LSSRILNFNVNFKKKKKKTEPDYFILERSCKEMHGKGTILLFHSITKAIDEFSLRKKKANNKKGIPIYVRKLILENL
jgi:hypothetical protein